MSYLPTPSNAAILRFSPSTPFWALTLSYGIFNDPDCKRDFGSLDHYLGYRMLIDPEHREAVMTAPNGYLAAKTLEQILAIPENRNAVISTWEQERDEVMLNGLSLKYRQSIFMIKKLLSTIGKPIIDDSRVDMYWCFVGGKGANRHGQLLEAIRDELAIDFPHYVPSKKYP